MGAPFTAELKEQPHALYRFWNAEGRLLYVGLTVDPGARWKVHRRDKSWWLNVRTVTLEWFPDRESVEIAEKAAIVAEMPLHNVAHQPPKPKPVRVLVSTYPLVEQVTDGRWLAVTEAIELLRPHHPRIKRESIYGLVKRGKIGVRRLPGPRGRLRLNPSDVAKLVSYHRFEEIAVPTAQPEPPTDG